MSKPNLHSILADPLSFISRLKIINKKGKQVNLTPTDEQLKMFTALESDRDCLFLKPRQIGSTTFTLAWLFYKWYTSTEPITVALMSHKTSSAKHLLNVFKRFYYSLPGPLKRELVTDNTTEVQFADTGARVMAVSAEGKGGLRSFSCNYLIISEYAFAPNPEELKATALGALNGNKLIIESTANFYGDALHQEIIKATRGEGDWNFVFFPWSDHKGYRSDPPRGWKPTDEHYQVEHRLHTDQMHWREVMQHRLGADKFRREYPLTLEEAFAQSGNAYFTDDDLRYVDVVQIEPENNKTYIYSEPDLNSSYAIGVDVASGRGGDYSVICVIDKSTYQPCAMFRSNTISPVQLAEKIHHLAIDYADAKVLVESNNWGLPVLNELRHRGYTNLWKCKNDRDWTTTTKSKLVMFEELKSLLAEGVITNIDSITFSEIRSFQVDERGLAPSVPKNLDHHGDAVIALALAAQCLKSVILSKNAFLPDWVKRRRADRIINSALGMKERRR